MTGYPLGRDRAGVIVLVDGRLALIDRVRPGSPAPYSVVPGGGVEAGETPAEAALREAREELGLEVRLRSDEPTFRVRTPDHEEHYFLADAVAGEFGPGGGPEWDPDRGRGTYTPVLVTPEEALARELVPFEVAEALLQAFVTGRWPDTTVELTDPRVGEPGRVRSAGFCLDDGRVLLLRGRMEDVPPGPGPAPSRTGVFYEVPGGGVEAGETPEEAVVRELEEELGLHVRIERELATVWRPGGVSVRQHYFLLRPDGTSGRTADDFDHEEFFTPIWVDAAALAHLPVWPKRLGWRFARWHATGEWPMRPLHLTDVIRDLAPPCSW